MGALIRDGRFLERGTKRRDYDIFIGWKYISSGLFDQKFNVWAEFPMGSFHFPQWKMFFPID